MKQTLKKGFTLIELLVVIAIIALLSTLAVVSLNNARSKSRDAKRVSDIKQLQTSLELYFADQQGYPANTAGITAGGDSAKCLGNSGWATANDSTCGTTIYMGQVPSNPTPNGAAYVYSTTTTASPSTYSITFTLEGQTGTLAGTSHTASPSGIQ